MARRPQLSVPGSTLLTKLRILPMHWRKSVPSASPSQPDPQFQTIYNGGAFTGPGSSSVASPANSISIPDLVSVLRYTPAANNTPTITAHQVGMVEFDAGSVPYPIHPGDLLLVANQGSVDPVAGYAVDPLTNAGLFVAGPASIVVNTTTGASNIQVPVANPTAGNIAVPGTWLPAIYIYRYE